MKCLVIDDEAVSRGYVVTLLGDVADCDEADNGKAAVAKFTQALQEAPYDLLLLDIVMPEMNGHETARAIRSVEREHGIAIGERVNIVMLTSLNSSQDAMESFCCAQSAAYIVKPVSRDSLFKTISQLGLLRKESQPRA